MHILLLYTEMKRHNPGNVASLRLLIYNSIVSVRDEGIFYTMHPMIMMVEEPRRTLKLKAN